MSDRETTPLDHGSGQKPVSRQVDHSAQERNRISGEASNSMGEIPHRPAKPPPLHTSDLGSRVEDEYEHEQPRRAHHNHSVDINGTPASSVGGSFMTGLTTDSIDLEKQARSGNKKSQRHSRRAERSATGGRREMAERRHWHGSNTGSGRRSDAPNEEDEDEDAENEQSSLDQELEQRALRLLVGLLFRCEDRTFAYMLPDLLLWPSSRALDGLVRMDTDRITLRPPTTTTTPLFSAQTDIARADLRYAGSISRLPAQLHPLLA